MKRKKYEDKDYKYQRERPFSYFPKRQIDDIKSDGNSLADIAVDESDIFWDIPFEELEKFLMLLTERQLDIFLLILGHLSQREIASLYELSQSSVRDRLKCVKNKLMKYKNN